MSVLLHIGWFKTGTTSLQQWLRDHPAELAAAGYRFPEGWLRLNNHLEPHMLFMRPDRLSRPRAKGDEWRDPAWRDDLTAQIREDLEAHTNLTTILSGEQISMLRYDDELAPLAELIGRDANILFVERGADAWHASMQREYEKYGFPLGNDEDAVNDAGIGPWITSPSFADPWIKHFAWVTSWSYEQLMEANGSVLPQFLSYLGLDVTPDVTPGAEYWLNYAGGPDYDGHVPGTRWSGGRFGKPLQTRTITNS